MKVRFSTIFKAHASFVLTWFGLLGMLFLTAPELKVFCILAYFLGSQLGLDARISLIEQRLEPKDEKDDTKSSTEVK